MFLGAPARAARRPAVAQGADDRLRPRPARRVRGAAVRRTRSAAIVALAAVAGIGTAFFRPAVLAGLPNLVAGRASSRAANALLQLVEWTTIGGRARSLGGALTAASGPDLAYWVNAATFALSAAARGADPGPAAAERAADRPRALGRPRGGLPGRPPLARAHVRARRLVDRDARERRRSTSRRCSSRRARTARATSASGCSGPGPASGSCSAGSPRRSLLARGLGGGVRPPAARLRRRDRGAPPWRPNVWIGALGDGARRASATAARSSRTSRSCSAARRTSVRGRAFTLLMSANYAVLGLALRARGPDHERRRRALGVRGRLGDDPARRPASHGGWSRGVEQAQRDARRGGMTRERLDDRRRSSRASAPATPRALARAISLVEDADPAAYELVRAVYPHTGGAYAVGLTGLAGRRQVDPRLRARRPRSRRRAARSGVISVDPSSPFTAGRAARRPDPALASTSSTPASSSARWARAATPAASPRRRCRRCSSSTRPARTSSSSRRSATGQSEIGVISIADTVVLVLMPGSGDSIQALKAGIMEIPDVIVVNKLDHPLAATMRERGAAGARGSGRAGDWRPPVVLTEALRGDGIDELWRRIEEHRAAARVRRACSRSAARRQPRGGGVRGRLGARAPPSRERGRRRPGAAAAPRRVERRRARPADRRA